MDELTIKQGVLSSVEHKLSLASPQDWIFGGSLSTAIDQRDRIVV